MQILSILLGVLVLAATIVPLAIHTDQWIGVFWILTAVIIIVIPQIFRAIIVGTQFASNYRRGLYHLAWCAPGLIAANCFYFSLSWPVFVAAGIYAGWYIYQILWYSVLTVAPDYDVGGFASFGHRIPRWKKSKVFNVWYGTNRKLVDPNNVMAGFGSECDNRLHFGMGTVVIPKWHKIGSTGSTWWKRMATLRDDRLKLKKIVAFTENQYWASIARELEGFSADERDALVFIHGFNTSFREAAIRAAQIGADLKVPGITAFYSWPSKGTLKGYFADEETIQASEEHMTKFLIGFAQISQAERVHIVAHSMGNRALLRSMQDIASNAAKASHKPFGQIILAAPDVSADLFRRLATAYTRVSERTTLYTSTKDLPLNVSDTLHDCARAGYTPPVTIVDGIDTVEVSEIDNSFFGHGYWAEARDMLHDMEKLIVNNTPPQRRIGLVPVDSNGCQYWRIDE